jgi:hypothetical protein
MSEKKSVTKTAAKNKATAAKKVVAKRAAVKSKAVPAKKAAPKSEAAPAKKAAAKSKAAPAKKAAPKSKAVPAKEKAAAKKAIAKKAAVKSKAVPAKEKVIAKKATVPAKKSAAKKSAAKSEAVPAKKSAVKSASKSKAVPTNVAPSTTSLRPPDGEHASPSSSPPRPSERAMAISAQLPKERALTDEERDAMTKVAQTALAALETDGVPELIVARIGAFVDEIRTGARPEPNSQDVRLGLGVLWGEQVRAQVGWRWVHLSYPNGFASYALVPDDRAFACFPLNRVAELMTTRPELSANTSVPLFDSIRVGTLPARRENAYLVIG